MQVHIHVRHKSQMIIAVPVIRGSEIFFSCAVCVRWSYQNKWFLNAYHELVRIESPSSNDLELNIIEIHSPYFERAITSSLSAVIGRRDFTHISSCVSLKMHTHPFYIIITTWWSFSMKPSNCKIYGSPVEHQKAMR